MLIGSFFWRWLIDYGLPMGALLGIGALVLVFDIADYSRDPRPKSLLLGGIILPVWPVLRFLVRRPWGCGLPFQLPWAEALPIQIQFLKSSPQSRQFSDAVTQKAARTSDTGLNSFHCCFINHCMPSRVSILFYSLDKSLIYKVTRSSSVNYPDWNNYWRSNCRSILKTRFVIFPAATRFLMNWYCIISRYFPR